MPRIIAGEFRSRRLAGPPDDAPSRPYLDHIKESVFNLLRGWFENARVLDLFAGVGTVGLEAVSRGASAVVMVEKNPRVHRILEENIKALRCEDRAVAIKGDALSPTSLLRAPRPVDLVFIDPPFEMLESASSREKVLAQIQRCREVMAEKGFVVLRSPLFQEAVEWAIPGFDGPEVHRYGKISQVMLYAPSG